MYTEPLLMDIAPIESRWSPLLIGAIPTENGFGIQFVTDPVLVTALTHITTPVTLVSSGTQGGVTNNIVTL